MPRNRTHIEHFNMSKIIILCFYIKLMKGIIGKKMGMAQVFDENGRVIPVTYLSCEPNTVFDIKTVDRDGYSSLVLGANPLGKKETKTKKFKTLKEFSGDVASDVVIGSVIDASIFEAGEFVSVVGVSKGKGFQGRVRRHNSRVARKTHGTKAVRHGSSGSMCITARSQPGLTMAGRMGNDKVTLRSVEIVRVDAERSIIAVKGPVPGAINSIVFLKKS